MKCLHSIDEVNHSLDFCFYREYALYKMSLCKTLFFRILKFRNFSSFSIIDIDECEESVCEQTCTNTPGSFNCSCTIGYDLATDERSCVGKKLILLA